MDPEKFTWNRDNMKRGLFIALIIGVGLSIAIAFFFLVYSGETILGTIGSLLMVIRPFIIGAVIAYIMKSTCNFYEKHLLKALLKSKKRPERKAQRTANILAVIFAIATWAIILTALFTVATRQIVLSALDFISDMKVQGPIYLEQIHDILLMIEAKFPETTTYLEGAYNWMVGWVMNLKFADFQPLLSQFGNDLINGVMSFATLMKDIVIGFIAAAFFLAGRKKFASLCTLAVRCIFKKKVADLIIDEARFADKMFSGFMEGKVIDSTILGLIYYVAFVIMDFPYAALLALICGCTNVIPFFGPYIGAIPSGIILLATTQDPIKLICFIIFVVITQFVEGNIIEPNVVGGSINMSPFGVIFAVITFGGLFGFWGLLIGVPTFAIICDIVKKIAFAIFRKKGQYHLVEEYMSKYKDEPEEDTKKKFDLRKKFSKKTKAKKPDAEETEENKEN